MLDLALESPTALFEPDDRVCGDHRVAVHRLPGPGFGRSRDRGSRQHCARLLRAPGALALMTLLVPVTLTMHGIWAAPDAMTEAMQRVQFLKNLAWSEPPWSSLTSAQGPISLDARHTR